MEVTGDAGRLFALRIYPVAPETIPDIREFERLLNTVPKRKRFRRVVLPDNPAAERLNVREVLFYENPKPAPFEY